jgi:hypothetical protein
MSKFEELELASARLRDRQANAEAAARQFIADCKWALADYLGTDEHAIHFYGERANSEFHWENDALQFLLVLTVGGTEFRFRVRFRPELVSNGHVVSVAGSEPVQYPLHGGIWQLAEKVVAFIRHYFDNSNHVEPVVTVPDQALAPERSFPEAPRLAGRDGAGTQAPS